MSVAFVCVSGWFKWVGLILHRSHWVSLPFPSTLAFLPSCFSPVVLWVMLVVFLSSFYSFSHTNPLPLFHTMISFFLSHPLLFIFCCHTSRYSFFLFLSFIPRVRLYFSLFSPYPFLIFVLSFAGVVGKCCSSRQADSGTVLENHLSSSNTFLPPALPLSVSLSVTDQCLTSAWENVLFVCPVCTSVCQTMLPLDRMCVCVSMVGALILRPTALHVACGNTGTVLCPLSVIRIEMSL